MPNQSMPMGLLSKDPRLRHRLVKSALETVGWMMAALRWMVSIILVQPPAWMMPRIGMSSEPAQIKKYCSTSLKTAESRPPNAT